MCQWRRNLETVPLSSASFTLDLSTWGRANKFCCCCTVKLAETKSMARRNSILARQLATLGILPRHEIAMITGDLGRRASETSNSLYASAGLASASKSRLNRIFVGVIALSLSTKEQARLI
jgi:hypothetical protein